MQPTLPLGRPARRLGLATLLLGALLTPLASAPALAVEDALETPAISSELAPRSLLLDVTRAGDRLVAVGERGHILVSEDDGRRWQQARVPVRVTLTAVDFPTPQRGWAVGHAGVILHSEDGGATWTKQLDGHRLNAIVRDQTAALLADAEAGRADDRLAIPVEDLAFLAEDAQAFVEEGPSRPLLDVSFRDDQAGMVVGAYGLILETEDGGTTWRSRVGHLENAFGFHFYAIERLGETLFVAGEAGSLHRSTDGGAHWERLASPYDGTFFGLVGDAATGRLIAHGLRGHVYRSSDLGARWQRIETGIDAAIEGGTLLPDGDPLLVGQGGTLLQGEAGDRRYTPHHLPDRRAYSAVTTAGDGRAVIVGQGGIRRVDPAAPTAEVN